MISSPVPELYVKEVVTWRELGLCGSMSGGSAASDWDCELLLQWGIDSAKIKGGGGLSVLPAPAPSL